MLVCIHQNIWEMSYKLNPLTTFTKNWRNKLDQEVFKNVQIRPNTRTVIRKRRWSFNNNSMYRDKVNKDSNHLQRIRKCQKSLKVLRTRLSHSFWAAKRSSPRGREVGEVQGVHQGNLIPQSKRVITQSKKRWPKNSSLRKLVLRTRKLTTPSRNSKNITRTSKPESTNR